MPSIAELVSWFESRGQQIVGSADGAVSTPRAINDAGPDNITFISPKVSDKAPELLRATDCRFVIVHSSMESILDEFQSKELVFVLSENPKHDILEYCTAFLGFNARLEKTEIHPSALISDKAKIGERVEIAANVVVEAGVIIGDDCRIGANSVIKKNTHIGKAVEMGSCNVIGGVGFGYAQDDASGEYHQLPHYGKVIIHDHVEIGNNTCIDRGSLSDTVLAENVKVDNLVHIAHNVKIGRNSLIIACSMIAGSVEIGENCWVAPCSAVRNGIKIGDNALVGLSSAVTKSVSDDAVVLGNPAMSLEEFKAWRKLQKRLLEKG